MSTDPMLRAAEKLRSLADAATPGPWEAFEQHGRDISDEGWSHVGVKNATRDVAVTYPTGSEHDEHEADAALIAALGPEFARRVANLLDVTARDVGTSSIAYHAALAVVRHLLEEGGRA